MKLTQIDTETGMVGGIFVGNPLSFSDTALRLVEAELPCMSCLRTPAVNDLLLIGPERASSIRLIVVDESLLEDLTKVWTQLLALFPMATLALAFRNPANARLLIGRLQSNPSWGSVGFLPMNTNLDCWLSIVRLLASGEKYVPAQLFGADEPAAGAAAQSDTTDSSERAADTASGPDVHLTARELQVLKSAAEGKQNKIIADELELSQHTVKLHMHHIIAKLGVHNRTEAANWFHGRHAQK